MVTICTTSLAFNNSTFCAHTTLLCFVWVSEQTAIISLTGFVIEAECVYYGKRTGSLNIIQVNLGLERVRSQLSLSEFYDGQSCNKSGFSPGTLVLLCQ